MDANNANPMVIPVFALIVPPWFCKLGLLAAALVAIAAFGGETCAELDGPLYGTVR